jgi:hypothetical protein
MPTPAVWWRSAARRLAAVAPLNGALVHQLPVDGSKDSLLALAKSRVGLGRLRHRHDRPSLQLTTRGRAEMARKRVRREPQHPLQLGDPLGLRCGLASQPLRNRGLGDAQRGSKLPLGQLTLGTRTSECSCEVRPLVGRRHVRILSQVEGA